MLPGQAQLAGPKVRAGTSDMADEKGKQREGAKGGPGSGPATGNPERRNRLAGELRDNLKRRKGQSRSRGEETPPGALSRDARKTLIDPD